MSKKNHLLIIDPQNDFCDKNGNLSVPGGDQDMERLSKMIRLHKDKIDDIQVTLDSHQLVDIAHPIWWKDADGNHPDPFTSITKADVEGVNAKWRATNPAFQKRSVDYISALEVNGRNTHTIWPFHCMIGTWGHSVFPVLADALIEYQEQFADIKYVTKGSNPFTEAFSVVKADVPDAEDPTTGVNHELVNQLKEADIILVAGQALSHCVAATCRDLIAELGEEYARKFVILIDATSPVPGFEHLAEQFKADMKALGAKFSTTETFFD